MNKRQSITIEDVAKAAGVSRQTVSRVLNRKPGVKDGVRERIEEAIAELGYVPNLAARRMGGAKSFLIMAINDRQRTIENWSAGRWHARSAATTCSSSWSTPSPIRPCARSAACSRDSSPMG